MEIHENEDGVAREPGVLDTGEPSQWGPPGPDGGPNPHLVNTDAPDVAMPYTPENSPCKRDCRYYMHQVMHFDAANQSYHDGYKGPREHFHSCMRQEGVYRGLSADSPIYDCDQWDPLDPDEKDARELRREQYYERNPNIQKQED